LTTELRISIPPGVTPGRWARTYEQRNPRTVVAVTLVEEDRQLERLRAGQVDMAFVRLPVDREGLHLIPLYAEVPVAVVPEDHPAVGSESIVLADVQDELLDASALTWKDAFEVVAGGAGVLVVPMSVARLHHRRDVAAVPVSDAPETRIGLTWLQDTEDPRVEEFVGVVRGRTANSSRGASEAPKNAAEGRERKGRQPAKGSQPGKRTSGGGRPAKRSSRRGRRG
jgi:DNA-binding transcriptional LysR family regulator